MCITEHLKCLSYRHIMVLKCLSKIFKFKLDTDQHETGENRGITENIK